MSYATTTIWDVRSAGDDTNNGGGFDPGNTNFATDLTATSANTSAPVVSSASYTFVAGDVGAWLYVKSGTNWLTGWYPIVSVSAGAATLNATIGIALVGNAGLFPGGLNTVVGCASTASPTGGTWGVDYSKQNSGQFSFTDIVIDGTTNTKFTSAAFPVGKNFIGNVISITSGTGFTVQRIQIISTSTITATCDRSLGTLSSTGGTGKLGGALASPGQAMTLHNSIAATYQGGVFVKAATYLFSTTANGSGGKLTQTQQGDANKFFRIVGYNSTYLDYGTRPIFKSNGNSINLIEVGPSGSGGNILIDNFEFQISSGNTSVQGIYNTNGGGNNIVFRCYFNSLSSYGINFNNSSNHKAFFCTAKSCANGFSGNGASNVIFYGCVSTDNTSQGFAGGNNTQCFYCASARNVNYGFISVIAFNCVSVGNTAAGNGMGFNTSNCINCIAYGNAGTSGFNTSGATGGNLLYNCAGGSNTGGNYISSEYPNIWITNFITLTSDPFTSSATNDFSLNALAGGGALLKGTGFFEQQSNSIDVLALDIGKYQSAGGTGGVTNIAY